MTWDGYTFGYTRNTPDHGEAGMGLTTDQAEALINEGWETFSDETVVGIGSLADALMARNALAASLEEARELPELLRKLSYDSGWLAAKLELTVSETPVEDAEAQVELIVERNTVFHKLAAILDRNRLGDKLDEEQ